MNRRLIVSGFWTRSMAVDYKYLNCYRVATLGSVRAEIEARERQAVKDSLTLIRGGADAETH